jgi:DNA processing protein
MAQDYSRDIFALPGRFNDSNSEGCNNLIKMQRAQLITSADDLVQSMQWQTASRQPVQMSMIGMLDGLTECQRVLLDKLGESENGLHVNQLVLELRLPYNDVASELMMLELKGHVRGLPGGIWRMVER